MTTVAAERPKITDADLADLARVKEILENPNFVGRMLAIIGAPVEGMINRLPDKTNRVIQKATTVSLEKALKTAIWTMGKNATGSASSNWWHRASVGVTGGVGGACGWLALPIELPLSTTLMLRSIADIARSKGEDLETPEAQLSCIEVFALGGRTSVDDAINSSYFATRIALARVVGEAAAFLAEDAVAGLAAEKAAPVLVRFITSIAERFSIQVSEKVIATAIPVVGAAGGAAINVAFICFFQEMAEGHFTVRALERKYGEAQVRLAYEQLPTRRSKAA